MSKDARVNLQSASQSSINIHFRIRAPEIDATFLLRGEFRD